MQNPIIHHPFEFPLGPIDLTGFGLAVFLAFAISQVICQRELTRRGHFDDADVIPDLILMSVLGTLIGGKLYYTLVITHDFRDLLSRAGFVFWGGFIGAVTLNFLFVRYKKLSFVRFADVAGIAIAAGYSVGRSGCWAVGDDYGRPYTGFMAVAFPQGAPPSRAGVMNSLFGTPIPDGATIDTVLSVHPTQLYETVLGFAMFLILWRLRNHKHAEGWLFGVYCVLAGVERFIIEIFRAKDDRYFGPFTAAQAIGMSIAVIGLIIMWRRNTVGAGRLGIMANDPSTAAVPA